MKKIKFPDDFPKDLTAYDFEELENWIAYVEWLAELKKNKNDNNDDDLNLNLDYIKFKDDDEFEI